MNIKYLILVEPEGIERIYKRKASALGVAKRLVNMLGKIYQNSESVEADVYEVDLDNFDRNGYKKTLIRHLEFE